MNKIYLAGGCFWGVQAYFELLKGITKTTVGYANGTIEAPTYEQVCSNEFGFVEVVEVFYDNKISLEKILEYFIKEVDIFSFNQQGSDIGAQYRSGVYYQNQTDYKQIKTFFDSLQKKYEKKIQVEILELKNYYLAEAMHQNYLDKNPSGYCHLDLNKISKELNENEKK